MHRVYSFVLYSYFDLGVTLLLSARLNILFYALTYIWNLIHPHSVDFNQTRYSFHLEFKKKAKTVFFFRTRAISEKLRNISSIYIYKYLSRVYPVININKGNMKYIGRINEFEFNSEAIDIYHLKKCILKIWYFNHIHRTCVVKHNFTVIYVFLVMSVKLKRYSQFWKYLNVYRLSIYI